MKCLRYKAVDTLTDISGQLRSRQKWLQEIHSNSVSYRMSKLTDFLGFVATVTQQFVVYSSLR